MLSFSECLVYVCMFYLFYLFIPFLSVFFVFHGQNVKKGGSWGGVGGGVGENKTEGSLHKIGVARNPLPTIG